MDRLPGLMQSIHRPCILRVLVVLGTTRGGARDPGSASKDVDPEEAEMSQQQPSLIELLASLEALEVERREQRRRATDADRRGEPSRSGDAGAG